jgi:CheY-like chemotaxis protein
MTADTVAKAFEPFFTTKPIGQGTGLGLSMIYGFTQQSNGYAKIYSEVAQRTTIKLYLPRHYAAVEAEPVERLDLGSPREAEQGQTILVVEDEPSVRSLVVELLRERGFSILEASDGPAGLALLESSARIDLLVTDVGLPGLNGRQMADAARNRRPGLPILFMTGYAENAAIANGFLAPGMEMITKPFAMGVFVDRVLAIIEAAA